MKTKRTSSTTAVDPRVRDAVAQLSGALAGAGIVSVDVEIAGELMAVALARGETACRRLRGALSSTADGSAPPADFPKLPYVSFYSTPDKAGKPIYRATFRVPGYVRRTDRLGRDGKKAYKWARHVSDVIDQVKSRTMKAEEAHRLLYVDRSPIETYVTQYERALITKGVNEQYRKTTLFRIRKCLELADVSRWDHLTGRIVGPLLEQLRKVEAGPGKAREIVSLTVNGYLNDLRKFTRWMTKKLTLPADPLQHAQGVQVKTEEGRRRDATPEDLKEIYRAAMNDKLKRGMRGPDRAMLYLVAFCTGLRRKELRAAMVSWLRLGEKEPHLILPMEFAKNTQRATQPLPKWLADMLTAWLKGRAAGKLFPTMPRDIIKPFNKDRKAARKAWVEDASIDEAERKRRRESDFLEYKTSDGLLLFHSFRHGYASALLDSGADLKLAQFLTRHSTIQLLADRYGHARRSKTSAAVEDAIPNPVAGVTVGGQQK